MSDLLFLDQTPDPASLSPFAIPPDPEESRQGRPTYFQENFRAAYTRRLLSDNSMSREANYSAAYQPIVDALNQGLPAGPGSRRFRNPFRVPGTLQAGARSDQFSEEALVQNIWQEVTRRRQAQPGALPGLPGSREDLESQVRARVLEARETQEKIAAQSTTGGFAGAMVGDMAAAITDPPVLASLALGAPAGASVLRIALTEAMIGGGTEGVIQPSVAAYYEELGIDYTAADFVQNVGIGAAAGGVFAGGVAAAMRGLERVLGKLQAGEPVTPEERAQAAAAISQLNDRQIVQAVEKSGLTVNDSAADAVRAIKELGEVDDELPPDTDDATKARVRELIDDTVVALENDQPIPPGEGVVPQIDRPAEPGDVILVDPRTVDVDAKTFQFKMGGDAEGVTERLLGIREWNPDAAGQIIVYEYANGRRVIADGHQRLGLAKRLIAEESDGSQRWLDNQEIKLPARVYRETDGWTPNQVMRRAAIANIAQESGTAVDAALILRAADPAEMAVLPPRSAKVRQGRELAALDDEALRMVSHGVVPENYGAIVGRLAPNDPPAQIGIIRALHEMEPANELEAEAIVRQFLELRGDDEAITDLFGEQVLASSPIKERSRVLARTIKALRDDRRIFATLSRNRDVIEAAGNTLAEGNEGRAQTAAMAADLIMKLANRTGPVADALNAAARKAKEQGNYAQAVRDFTAVVRNAIEGGDLQGLITGQTARAPEGAGGAAAARVEATPSAAAAEADAALTLFDDPGSEALAAETERLERGLFDLDEDETVLIVTGQDDGGQDVMQSMTVKQVIAENEKEKDFLEQLKVCRA